MDPRLFTPLEPVYPQAARDAHIQGLVYVMAHVRADGTVDETHVVRSIPALDAAAVEAVKRARFRPGFLRDRPVPAWIGVPVRFTLH